jgi:flagellar basal body-associated protein FliL
MCVYAEAEIRVRQRQRRRKRRASGAEHLVLLYSLIVWLILASPFCCFMLLNSKEEPKRGAEKEAPSSFFFTLLIPRPSVRITKLREKKT